MLGYTHSTGFFIARLLRAFISYTYMHTHICLMSLQESDISQIYLNKKLLAEYVKD